MFFQSPFEDVPGLGQGMDKREELEENQEKDRK